MCFVNSQFVFKTKFAFCSSSFMYIFRSLNTGVSNSFSAVGHVYIHGFYRGQTLEKNLSRKDCMSVVPKLFCLSAQETSRLNFAAHQPRHCLEIAISPSNDPRKSCDVAQIGADLQKKGHWFFHHHL